MSQQGKNAKREGARSNELYQLQALNRIVSAITGQGQPPAPAGIATETTLQAVLAAVDTMRDYEVRLVVDSAVTPVTWLEVRYWDAQTGALGAPQYYQPGSTVAGTPTGGITYINPQTLLAEIKAELIAANVDLAAIEALLTTIDADTSNLDVALSTLATEAKLEAVRVLLASIDSKAATETTLALVKAVLDNIKLDTANLLAMNLTLTDILADTAELTVVKGATSVASTGVTNIPAGATEISIFNNGTGDALVNGTVCPPGVTRTFGFKNPTSAVIVCDGGGTEELIIDYMV